MIEAHRLKNVVVFYEAKTKTSIYSDKATDMDESTTVIVCRNILSSARNSMDL